MNRAHIFGVILLIYGTIKLTIGLTALILTNKAISNAQNNAILKDFISSDLTLAGKVFEYTLIIFAIYTIITGIYLLGIIKNKQFNQLMHNQLITYILYISMGVFLILFYYIVLYTSIDIQKDPTQMATYKLFGLGSGLMFLIMFVIIYSFFHYKKFTLIHYIAISIIIVGISIAFYNIIKSSISLLKSKKNEIITLIMIPIVGIY
jgi:hypothetical protein